MSETRGWLVARPLVLLLCIRHVQAGVTPGSPAPHTANSVAGLTPPPPPARPAMAAEEHDGGSALGAAPDVPGGGGGPAVTANEHRARAKIRPLWQPGDLFHVTARYPDDSDGRLVDRLAGILKRGLVAPARCDQGTVRSNIRVTMEGAAIPYDHWVFLHRMVEWSRLYSVSEPGRFTRWYY